MNPLIGLDLDEEMVSSQSNQECPDIRDPDLRAARRQSGHCCPAAAPSVPTPAVAKPVDMRKFRRLIVDLTWFSVAMARSVR